MTDLIRRDDALAKIHWLSDADWTVAERRAAGEIAAAQHRCQQLGKLAAQLFLHPRLQVEAIPVSVCTI